MISTTRLSDNHNFPATKELQKEGVEVNGGVDI